MKHILFVGENTARYWRHKNVPSNATENQTMPSWPEPVLHKSPGKGAQWFAESNTIRVKIFRPTRPPGGSKNVILCFFSKYEIHRGRHLYRIHKKAGTHRFTHVWKRYKVINFNKLINQSAWVNAKIERGMGGKVFFPQQRSRYKSWRLYS